MTIYHAAKDCIFHFATLSLSFFWFSCCPLFVVFVFRPLSNEYMDRISMLEIGLFLLYGGAERTGTSVSVSVCVCVCFFIYFIVQFHIKKRVAR